MFVFGRLAVPATPAGDCGSDRCRGQPVEPGRRAARWLGTGRTDQEVLKPDLLVASHFLLQPRFRTEASDGDPQKTVPGIPFAVLLPLSLRLRRSLA